MQRPDALSELMEELRGLDDRELPRILQSLSASERKQVLALLDRQEDAAEPNFALLVELSPWLVDRLTAARSGRSKGAPDVAMTAATCEALRHAEKELGSVRLAPEHAAPSYASPSLMERMFGRKPSAGLVR